MKTNIFLLLIFVPAFSFAQGIEFFHGSFQEAKELAARENKIIFVDAYTTWCGPCKRMAKMVFPQAVVGDYFNANLLCQDFDVIFFHDVLEHVPTVEEIKRLLGLIKVGVRIIIRLPVAMMEGDNYYFAVSRNDTTHIHCHAHYWWENLFHECGLVLDTVFPGTGREGIWESLGVLARAYTKEIEK